MKKGKLITIGGAIVVLALCGYFFMGTSSKGKISFQTEKVTRNSMTDVVVATDEVPAHYGTYLQVLHRVPSWA